MMNAFKTLARLRLAFVLCCLGIFGLGTNSAQALNPAPQPSRADGASTAPQSGANYSVKPGTMNIVMVPVSSQDRLVVPASIHGAIRLNQMWRFHTGDNPAWADPNFDDSRWDHVNLLTPLVEQGIEPYSGWAWYRLRLHPVPLPDSGKLALSLLVVPYSVGQMQILVNGVPVGHSQGMPEAANSPDGSQPTSYQSKPFIVEVSKATADGSVEIAVRSWADAPISHGLLDHVELGDSDSVEEKLGLEQVRQWDEHVLAGILVTFLFLSVTILGATLYLAQRNHAEYLWLSLLCLSVTLTGVIDTAFSASVLSLNVFQNLSLWAGRIFMAVTLEFVLRFTQSEYRRLVRIVQIAVLILPVFSYVPVPIIYELLSIAAQIVFCGVISVLLFRAWRKGRPEAGVMLIPFFLAATADSLDMVLDYAASKHWLSTAFSSHRFYLGPIEFSASTISYLIFLSSLIAVILYRFVHVSKDEQRSAAEIEAARSVQALLIPTVLPSNYNFVLESAYLPANGVGGDFFQVLPLKDDSMLIVVGDVSGKGLQAAMNASTLVGALRNELAHDPATVLNHLNHVMLGTTSGASASFATCLCARIYPSGKMTIANAGHLSPYREGRELELPSDLPLGVIAGIQYEESNFQLKVGDRLIFLSDGVVEATSPQGELFGFERTQQVSHEPARYIAQIAQRFGQNDDITVVSLYFAASTNSRQERHSVHAH